MTSLKVDKKMNKLVPGDKVRAGTSLVEWHSNHLCWSYGRQAPKDAGYGEGEKEIKVEDLQTVYIWSLYRLVNETPKGVVRHYGSETRDRESGKVSRAVWVDLVFKTELGDIKYGLYAEEKDLIKLVAGKKKPVKKKKKSKK